MKIPICGMMKSVVAYNSSRIYGCFLLALMMIITVYMNLNAAGTVRMVVPVGC
jgi:hypothetical protein